MYEYLNIYLLFASSNILHTEWREVKKGCYVLICQSNRYRNAAAHHVKRLMCFYFNKWLSFNRLFQVQFVNSNYHIIRTSWFNTLPFLMLPARELERNFYDTTWTGQTCAAAHIPLSANMWLIMTANKVTGFYLVTNRELVLWSWATGALSLIIGNLAPGRSLSIRPCASQMDGDSIANIGSSARTGCQLNAKRARENLMRFSGHRKISSTNFELYFTTSACGLACK